MITEIRNRNVFFTKWNQTMIEINSCLKMNTIYIYKYHGALKMKHNIINLFFIIKYTADQIKN